MNKKIIFGIFVLLFCLFNIGTVHASLICCLEQDGYCSSNKDASLCILGGGETKGSGSCWDDETGETTINECTLAGCVIPTQGKCMGILTAEQCEKNRGVIHTEIIDYPACASYSNSIEKGCCVSGPVCSSVVSEDYCENSFFPQSCESLGTSICSNECVDLPNICSDDRTGIDSRTSCGDKNYIPCGTDKKCFNDGETIECRFSSCNVGDVAKLERFNFGENTLFFEEVIITLEMLGRFENEIKTERKDGESWCIIYGTNDGRDWKLFSKQETLDSINVRKKYSAGSRHFVYSCVDGDIKVVPGSLYRETICFQNDEENYYLKGTEFEKYTSCNRVNSASTFYDIQDARKEIRNFMAETGSLSRGGKLRPGSTMLKGLVEARNYYVNKKNRAFLLTNYDSLTGCGGALYPVGGHFYDERIVNDVAPALTCSSCGGSKFDFNLCDENECYKKGDCGYKDAGAGNIALGCAAGAATAEALWLTMGSMGVHEQGGWTSIWQGNPVRNTDIGLFEKGKGLGAESPLLDGGTGYTIDPSLESVVVGERTPSIGEFEPTYLIPESSSFSGLSVSEGSANTWGTIKSLSGETGDVSSVSSPLQGAFDGARNIRTEGNPTTSFLKDKVSKVYKAGSLLRFVGARVDDQGNVRLYLDDPSSENPEYMIGDLKDGGVNPVRLFPPAQNILEEPELVT
jgi:hypothetical protein